MADIGTARRVGRDILVGWHRLPSSAAAARDEADRLLAVHNQLDAGTGAWPSGRAPSASWRILLDEDADGRGEVAA